LLKIKELVGREDIYWKLFFDLWINNKIKQNKFLRGHRFSYLLVRYFFWMSESFESC
jgi:hypothetical protein